MRGNLEGRAAPVTARSQGLCRRMMHPRMLRLRQNGEIVRRVVALIAVDVMDFLSLTEMAAELVLRHDAMQRI